VGIASISVLCSRCWNDLPDDQIEHVAAHVLQHLAPGGRFLDGWCHEYYRREKRRANAPSRLS